MAEQTPEPRNGGISRKPPDRRKHRAGALAAVRLALGRKARSPAALGNCEQSFYAAQAVATALSRRSQRDPSIPQGRDAPVIAAAPLPQDSSCDKSGAGSPTRS